MKNEIIDKLKVAGYITVTDDSQGIADKVGVAGGGGKSVFESNSFENSINNKLFENIDTNVWVGYLWNPNFKEIWTLEKFKDAINADKVVSNWCCIYPDPSILNTPEYDDLIQNIVEFREVPNPIDDSGSPVTIPVINMINMAPVDAIKNSGLADKIYVQPCCTGQINGGLHVEDVLMYCVMNSNDLKNNKEDLDRAYELIDLFINASEDVTYEIQEETVKFLRKYLSPISYETGSYKNDDDIKTVLASHGLPASSIDFEVYKMNAFNEIYSVYKGISYMFATPYVFVDGVKTDVNEIYDDVFSSYIELERNCIYGGVMMNAYDGDSAYLIDIWSKCNNTTKFEMDIIPFLVDMTEFFTISFNIVPAALNLRDVAPLVGPAMASDEYIERFYNNFEKGCSVKFSLADSIFGYENATPVFPTQPKRVLKNGDAWEDIGMTQDLYNTIKQYCEYYDNIIDDRSTIEAINIWITDPNHAEVTVLPNNNIEMTNIAAGEAIGFDYVDELEPSYRYSGYVVADGTIEVTMA